MNLTLAGVVAVASLLPAVNGDIAATIILTTLAMGLALNHVWEQLT